MTVHDTLHSAGGVLSQAVCDALTTITDIERTTTAAASSLLLFPEREEMQSAGNDMSSDCVEPSGGPSSEL